MQIHSSLFTTIFAIILLTPQSSEGLNHSTKQDVDKKGHAEKWVDQRILTNRKNEKIVLTIDKELTKTRAHLRSNNIVITRQLNWMSAFGSVYNSLKLLVVNFIKTLVQPADVPTTSPTTTAPSPVTSQEMITSTEDVSANQLEDSVDSSYLDSDISPASFESSSSTDNYPCVDGDDDTHEGGWNNGFDMGSMGGSDSIDSMVSIEKTNAKSNCGNNDVCGDGIIGESEECDGDNLNSATCSFIGCKSGSLTCNPQTCKLDYSQCGSEPGESLLQVKLTTDSHGKETFWEFTTKSGGDFIVGGGNYGDNKNYMKSQCVPTTECYEFKMYDTRGDGICCGFGNGGYMITFEGAVVPGTDSLFDGMAAHTICPADVHEDRCGDGIISVSEECDGNNFGGATCSTELGCSGGGLTCDPETCMIDYSGCTAGSGEVSFELQIETDDYGSETTWELSNNGITVDYGGPYGDDSVLNKKSCIKATDTCYQFVINDSGGDGLCCKYGEGSYSITVNGDEVPNTNGEFGMKADHSICTSP